jgi:transaldolase/glucose-6-phosphate isomerase
VAALVPMNPQRVTLPSPLREQVSATAKDWAASGRVARLWDRDASVWTNGDEPRWLGWLDAPEAARGSLDELRAFAQEINREGFTHALLLGMGGSSLAPEVIRHTFGHVHGAPDLHVLDSTDPAQVAGVESRVDLRRTLVIVASKSGSTLEPNVFKQYFLHKVEQLVGRERAGQQFIAITDPGSKMQQAAEADGFRRVFLGNPSIGGRFSALSPFGLVPAAVMGVDLRRFVTDAEAMAAACRRPDPVVNPGVMLGLVLGLAARGGRDKLTIVTSPEIFDLGAWLEQLIAESTGKQGLGIIPVDLEALRAPDTYPSDRVFVSLRTAGPWDAAPEEALNALATAGHPVVHIELADTHALAQEFFRWEIATAVAGAVLGINPFDQPDVEASKVATRELTTRFEESGTLPTDTPVLREGSLSFYADHANTRALERAPGDRSGMGLLKAHLARIGPGDYFALLAYVEMNAGHQRLLQDIRHLVASRTRAATCLGFGPRFLHSTGQAYKGGPNTGVFLQVTCDDAKDLPVPGQKYTFGVVKAAQAAGDLQVLNQRGRRALRVHLGPDVTVGLERLRSLVTEALA